MDKALVLASFGSADDSIREKTFDKLAEELGKIFTDFAISQAFTSNFLIKKLSRRGIFFATPAEKISQLRAEGFKKIFLLPTHLTPGEEFDNKIKICEAPDVKIIPPLMSEPLDEKILVTILNCFKKNDDEDLILIGHGSPHRHNPVYENLQSLAGEKIHIGVIEENDTPNFSDVVKRLKISRAKKFLLAPLLFNGGVHVAQDIAGEKNSWLTKLSALGYQVRVIRDGLGTFKKFRELYIKKLEAI
ncbi:MAG: sirohydrochlorin cobaltochelatase [Selenomonadaceae bacterium]|nr:sirohydrochlorin cobaltochelatase [Selenomonadaceae bacterium]